LEAWYSSHGDLDCRLACVTDPAPPCSQLAVAPPSCAQPSPGCAARPGTPGGRCPRWPERSSTASGRPRTITDQTSPAAATRPPRSTNGLQPITSPCRVGCAGRPPARLALNLGPHPYQGSTPGPVSPGLHLPPGRSMYGWRPLETARNRSAPMAGGPNVDQVRSPAGAAALRIADLGWQGRPPPTAPDKRAPPGRSPC
jgi:hypothetical protein